MQKRVIVWFRNDLRVHDNEALRDAIHASEEVVPVYIFDERTFLGKTKLGFKKTEKFRAKFIQESVTDLKSKLAEIGLNLYVRIGKPEEEIFQLANKIKSSWIFCNRERTQEEVDVQDALEHNLWSIGQEIRYSRGKMLYYTSDLPFPVTHTPDIFSQFRKEVERFVSIREPIPVPEICLNKVSIDIDYGQIPCLESLGHKDFGANDKGGFIWKGGESEAKKQLQYYLWDSDLISSYKETRNGLLGRDFSSKLSPWLALGCLSPKYVYAELKKYESERTENKSTYWLFFELLWRDFFRLIGKKYGNNIFKPEGTKGGIVEKIENDVEKLERWTKGNTGIPFIDANMRELNATGFMSNRGRQNVASFLVKDLNLDWRLGAEYFESLLLDYDPCSNYGNWNYIAGVGSDPREDRYFNIISQAKRYDSNAEYIKYWLPELSKLPNDIIFTPDQSETAELLKLNVNIGVNYPLAMVSTSKWIK